MEYEPTVNALVEYVATPLLFSVPVPNWPIPSANVTVPVGVALPPVTAAVRVTDAVWATGLGDAVKATLDAPGPAVKTVSVTAVEVDAE
jgi:hypothetical protein